MTTLLTTTIPPTYIGTDTVSLPIGKYHIAIQLRFTVFGELLEYDCPAIELPEAALKLTFTAEDLKLIHAEIEYLPYRLMLMAFQYKTVSNMQVCGIWQPVMAKLKQLQQSKHLKHLNLPVTHEFAEELKVWLTQKNKYVNFRMIFDGKAINFRNLPRSPHIEIPVLTYHLFTGKDGQTRQKAVELMEKLGSNRAVEPLLAALSDKYSHVRAAAAKGLGKLEDIRAVEPLIALLSDSSAEVQANVVLALGKLKDARAVEPLIPFLTAGPLDIRNHAAVALGNIADARAVEPLITALSSTFQRMRTSVIGALSKMKDERVLDLLISALRDKSFSVRNASVWGLGHLGDARALVPLISALNDKKIEVRKSAAFSLGMLGDARATEPLTKLLGSKNTSLRSVAMEALGKIGRAKPPSTEEVSKQDNDIEEGKESVSPVNNTVKDRLIWSLIVSAGDKNFNARSIAINSLGKSKNSLAFEPLLAAMKDKYSSVRCSAATALGNLRDVRAVPVLLTALKDKSMEVRYCSANSLAKFDDTRAVAPIITLALKSKSLSYQGAINTFTAKCKDVALPLLIRALANKKYKTRTRAVWLLGALGDTRALPLLTGSLSKEKSITCKKAKLNVIAYLEKLNNKGG